MKNLRYFAVTLSLVITLSSCGKLSGLFGGIFKHKTGCPSNGKNVGAEKILSGDPEAAKSVKKAKKFRS